MRPLETDRLVIRNFRTEDWRALQELVVTYQASEVARYDHLWPTAAEEIKGIAEWFAGNDSYLAVCLKGTGQLIGLIGLNPGEEDEGVAFHLGYVFHAKAHGHGFGTESCRAVLDYAFGPLGADKVVTNTAAANEPSCRLLRRLGMRQTGQDVGSFRETRDGEPIEFVALSFAVSKEEWAAQDQAAIKPAGDLAPPGREP